MKRYILMRTKILQLLVLILAGLFFSSFSPSETDPSKDFVVVLDAGHGGDDPGNRGPMYS